MRGNSDMMAAMFASIEDGRYHADQVMNVIYDGIEASLKQAQIACRGGDKARAIEKLRELQAHAERLIGVLSPEDARKLSAV